MSTLSMSRSKNNQEWLDNVSRLGCIVCALHLDVFSPALIHHIRTWRGKRISRDDKFVLPLCHEHHNGGKKGVAFHASEKLWKKNYGSQESLLKEVHDRLIEKWGCDLVYPLDKKIEQFSYFLDVEFP